jgi:2'-5' RNA ligase
MRAFIAVNLDENLRRSVAETQEKLRATGAEVKWVKPESVHLTLKFLGWVDEGRVPEVIEAVGAALKGAQPFRLRLEGVGGFPTPSAPRVIWVGVKEGAQELSELAQRVEAALEPLGFVREERGFSPHATIGRRKGPGGRQALAAVMQTEGERAFGEMQVKRVELMRSDLRPTGPIYTSQRAFDLAPARAGRGEA